MYWSSWTVFCTTATAMPVGFLYGTQSNVWWCGSQFGQQNTRVVCCSCICFFISAWCDAVIDRQLSSGCAQLTLYLYRDLTVPYQHILPRCRRPYVWRRLHWRLADSPQPVPIWLQCNDLWPLLLVSAFFLMICGAACCALKKMISQTPVVVVWQTHC